MKTKRPWLLILILVFGLLLTGCGSNASPTPNTAQMTEVMQRVQSTLTQIAVETQYVSPQPTATNTAIPPTSTPLPEPTATETPIPTDLPPTQTPQPIATVASPVLMIPEARIKLEPNATQILVVGMVKANTIQRYIFNGVAGQLVDIILSSGQACSLSVSGKDGTVLVNSLDESQHFHGDLTSTQDWFIDIHPGGANIDFELYLIVP